MQLISEEYRKLNTQLHVQNLAFGVNGGRNAHSVMQLCQKYNTHDVLDYGCGKGALSRNLPFIIQNYDPALPKFKTKPQPADIVVCSDVLEHIEPECVDNVINHLASLTKKILLTIISIKPAMKNLPDGRNAHLSIHDSKWWIDKLSQHFEIMEFQRQNHEIFMIFKSKEFYEQSEKSETNHAH